MPHPARLLGALGPDAAPADADLLARFARTRDAGAFELLVHRHAPLVLRACRGVLRDRHTAEDAAQATFLALARQAKSVRGDTLPGWLFRVARRVAARTARPLPVVDADPDSLPAAETPTPDPGEVRALHDELARLPEAYRSPLLLAYFEGLTYPEVARRLGWPLGTVTGRVARAKAALGVRLARRGLAPVLLLAGAVPVPPAFARATAEAAVAYAAGTTAGLPAAVTGPATREVRRMTAVKVAKAVGVVLMTGAVALGFGAASEADPPPPARPPAQVVGVSPAPVQVPKAVVERTFFVAPVTTALHRLLLRGTEESRAVVWVDGSVMLRDAPLNAPTTDLHAIQSALRDFRAGRDRPVAHLMVFFAQGTDPPLRERDLLSYALEGTASRAGYVATPMLTAHPHVGFELSNWTAPLRDATGWDAAEPGAGDDRARAYPVRTPLSRVLTNSAGGLVEVTPGKARPAYVERSVVAAVAALDLPRGRTVDFLFHIGDEDEREYVWVRNLLRKAVESRGLAFGTRRKPLG